MLPLRSVALMLAAAAPAAVLAQAPAPVPSTPAPRAIQVTGEGRVHVAPDVARVVVGAITTGKDLRKVSEDAAAVLRRLLAELSKVGIEPKDVRTIRHDLQVERPWASTGKPGPISGYTVNDQVQVTVRELPRLGAVLERATAAGGNSVEQLSMEKEEPGPDRARALALAYAAARTKAEAIAKAAGVSLGEVLAVEEGTGERAPIPILANRMAMAESAAAPAIAAGDLELTGAVTVRFAIR